MPGGKGEHLFLKLVHSLLTAVKCPHPICQCLSCWCLPLHTDLYNYEKYGCPYRKGNRYYYSHNSGLQNQYVVRPAAGSHASAPILVRTLQGFLFPARTIKCPV